MKELSPHDRPREKLTRCGVGTLGDNEVLALVIGSGSRDSDALKLANHVLERAGGLQGLTRSTQGDLRQVSGVGAVRASQILAAVELGRRTLVRGGADRVRMHTPGEIAAHLLPLYGAAPVEQFGVALLDTRHRLMRVRILSVGSLDSTVVHPREVFREAAFGAAAHVVLFHNHPSGDPSPSQDDVELTSRMLKAGDIMGIEVLDHLILADQRYYSFWEAGYMVRGRLVLPG
ncbi:MAG: DNA repair protein RadC [Vicinamibacterales bacterium]